MGMRMALGFRRCFSSLADSAGRRPRCELRAREAARGIGAARRARRQSAGRLGRRARDADTRGPEPGSERPRDRARSARRQRRDPARHDDARVDLQRHRPGSDDSREGRRSRHRALQELAARGDDDPLARHSSAERDGRRAGRDAGARSQPAANSATTSCSRTPARIGITRTRTPSAQVGRGLYGAFVVDDPNDPKEFGDDLVMMLSGHGPRRERPARCRPTAAATSATCSAARARSCSSTARCCPR